MVFDSTLYQEVDSLIKNASINSGERELVEVVETITLLEARSKVNREGMLRFRNVRSLALIQ